MSLCILCHIRLGFCCAPVQLPKTPATTCSCGCGETYVDSSPKDPPTPGHGTGEWLQSLCRFFQISSVAAERLLVHVATEGIWITKTRQKKQNSLSGWWLAAITQVSLAAITYGDMISKEITSMEWTIDTSSVFASESSFVDADALAEPPQAISEPQKMWVLWYPISEPFPQLKHLETTGNHQAVLWSELSSEHQNQPISLLHNRIHSRMSYTASIKDANMGAMT